MNERIKQIRKNANLTLEKFGKRIGITAASCSNIESGKTNPSNQTIQAICKEFGCNEIWLRTGEGDPFQEESRQEQIMRFAAQTISGSDEFKKSFVSMLAKLDAEDWEALARIFGKLAGETKKE
jgi:transcriptional regulator with XRE-family HTH domain